jgi:hypothetical protein
MKEVKCAEKLPDNLIIGLDWFIDAKENQEYFGRYFKTSKNTYELKLNKEPLGNDVIGRTVPKGLQVEAVRKAQFNSVKKVQDFLLKLSDESEYNNEHGIPLKFGIKSISRTYDKFYKTFDYNIGVSKKHYKTTKYKVNTTFDYPIGIMLFDIDYHDNDKNLKQFNKKLTDEEIYEIDSLIMIWCHKTPACIGYLVSKSGNISPVLLREGIGYRIRNTETKKKICNYNFDDSYFSGIKDILDKYEDRKAQSILHKRFFNKFVKIDREFHELEIIECIPNNNNDTVIESTNLPIDKSTLFNNKIKNNCILRSSTTEKIIIDKESKTEVPVNLKLKPWDIDMAKQVKTGHRHFELARWVYYNANNYKWGDEQSLTMLKQFNSLISEPLFESELKHIVNQTKSEDNWRGGNSDYWTTKLNENNIGYCRLIMDRVKYLKKTITEDKFDTTLMRFVDFDYKGKGYFKKYSSMAIFKSLGTIMDLKPYETLSRINGKRKKMKKTAVLDFIMENLTAHLLKIDPNYQTDFTTALTQNVETTGGNNEVKNTGF